MKRILITIGSIIVLGLIVWKASASSPLPTELNIDTEEATSSTPISVATSSTPTTPEIATVQPVSLLRTFPTKVIQGDPVEVLIDSATSTSAVKSLTFNNKSVPVFIYNGKVRALIGLDLRMIPGTYPIVLTLTDGKIVEKDLVVGKKVIASAPLGIPDKLGGNTAEGEQNVVSTLVSDSAQIADIDTSSTKLWTSAFRFPIAPPITITDVFGYSRITGSSQIAHKGTDFRAPIGTPVYAMNDGVVRFTKFLTTYGNTVIIDHGLGLQTFYLHLSEIKVGLGDSVRKGDLIGLSGDTGYVEGPHLHLTIRINNISIDPVKFLDLFGPDGQAI